MILFVTNKKSVPLAVDIQSLVIRNSDICHRDTRLAFKVYFNEARTFYIDRGGTRGPYFWTIFELSALYIASTTLITMYFVVSKITDHFY